MDMLQDRNAPRGDQAPEDHRQKLATNGVPGLSRWLQGSLAARELIRALQKLQTGYTGRTHLDFISCHIQSLEELKTTGTCGRNC